MNIQHNKLALIISFLVGALSVGAFTQLFQPAVKDSITFPLYTDAEGCVRSKFDSIQWIDKTDVSYVTFTNNPTSVIPVKGYVDISLKHQNKDLIEPVVNAVFHDCYPENVSAWKITEPKDQSLQFSMSVLQSELKGRSKRASVEIDMVKSELKYSIWP